jgi:hypothetical protein
MIGSEFEFSSSLNTTVALVDVGCEKKAADMSQDFFVPTSLLTGGSLSIAVTRMFLLSTCVRQTVRINVKRKRD